MSAVRSRLTQQVKTLDEQEYCRVRLVNDIPTTPEGVTHHLMQHGAEHRGEIMLVASLFHPKP